jgi:hypothetical protein
MPERARGRRPASDATDETVSPHALSGVVIVDGYVRCSDGSAWSRGALSIDRAVIAGVAAGRGWRVARVFEERSATSADQGGSLLRAALERVECGESNGLIVTRFTDVGGSLAAAIAALERIQAASGVFLSIREGVDLSTPAGRPILRLLISVLEGWGP